MLLHAESRSIGVRVFVRQGNYTCAHNCMCMPADVSIHVRINPTSFAYIPLSQSRLPSVWFVQHESVDPGAGKVDGGVEEELLPD